MQAEEVTDKNKMLSRRRSPNPPYAIFMEFLVVPRGIRPPAIAAGGLDDHLSDVSC